MRLGGPINFILLCCSPGVLVLMLSYFPKVYGILLANSQKEYPFPPLYDPYLLIKDFQQANHPQIHLMHLRC